MENLINTICSFIYPMDPKIFTLLFMAFLSVIGLTILFIIETIEKNFQKTEITQEMFSTGMNIAAALAKLKEKENQ